MVEGKQQRKRRCRGIARIFQSRGGGHTVPNIIVMAFSPRNIVDCLLKKRLTKGGHGHPRTPPPLATPLRCEYIVRSYSNIAMLNL